MKATGIVRRIDDLGRIVIPKEIRRTLRIREGDPLEIFTDREGKVILKKYSPIGELGTLAGIYADSLSKTLDCTVCITDTDQVIAAAGNGKKELQEMLLSAELAEVFQQRKTVLTKSSDAEFVAITKDRSEYREEIISVILSEGDIAGGVIFLQKNEKKHFGEMEKPGGSSDLEQSADVLLRLHVHLERKSFTTPPPVLRHRKAMSRLTLRHCLRSLILFLFTLH